MHEGAQHSGEKKHMEKKLIWKFGFIISNGLGRALKGEIIQ